MSRRVRRGIGAAVLGVLAAAAWSGWQTLELRSHLGQARDAATRMEAALDARDADAARAALEDLRAHSADAAEGSSGAALSLLSHLPTVGDDVSAVRVISHVLDDLAGDGLAPLVEIAERYRDGSLAPQRGRIPVRAVAELQEPVARSRAAFAEADDVLTRLEPESYVGQVAEATRQLRGIVADGNRTLPKIHDAVRLIPPFFGAEGPRRYLLVLQNNAEIRSTGGFAGSTFVIEANKGAIRLTNPVAGRTFPVLDHPVLPLTQSERALFPEAGTRFVNANLIPDFPRASELWAAHWQRRFGQQLDGVVATDPVTFSYLLGVGGPVQVGHVSLDSDNAVAELLSGTYARYTDPDAQDAFFRAAGEAAFEKVTSIADVAGLVEALRRSASEGRILIRAERGREQAIVERHDLAGVLRHAASGEPQLGIYVNDRTGTTGSKLSYYLRYDARMRAVSCRGGRQSFRGALDLRSTAPAGGLPEYVTGGSPDVPLGTQGLAIYLVGPVGGRLADVQVDGRAVPAMPVEHKGRPVVRVDWQLTAGASAKVTWRAVSGSDQTGAAEVSVTPPVEPVAKSFAVPTACGT